MIQIEHIPRQGFSAGNPTDVVSAEPRAVCIPGLFLIVWLAVEAVESLCWTAAAQRAE